ncbi:MAG TPA: hypothetical protein VGV86_12310 [Acidimicrobiales bacterium]|nr:hypothetical protein [Acidimicrobiales bacterium]
MSAWMRAVAQAWQEDWRATRPATKVVLTGLGMVCLAWVVFVIWFWFGFR